MYIIKNALRNIFRSKGKNLLIMILALVIAFSACIALSIRQSAEKARESTMADMEITANISIDRSQMMKQAGENGNPENSRDNMKSALQNMQELSIEEMESYAECESVKDFYYTQSASLNAGGSLEPVDSSVEDTEESSQQSTKQNTPPDGMPTGGENTGKGGPMMRGGMGSQGDFTVVGYSSEKAMTDFVSGASKITDGTKFDDNSSDKNCLISDELATLNSLSVGSTITLENPNNEDETVKFKVVGIYTSTSDNDSQMMGFNASQDKANQIYTSYSCLNSIITDSEKNATTSTDENTGMTMSSAIRGQSNGTYVFDSIENYEKFEDEARAKGLSEEYTVQSNDVAQFESSLVPLENLSSFAGWFLVIILIIGGIILVVFNMFNIRNRKYEIGVLTAIGMKKGKVALQFLIETFAVTFIAIILGTIIGACSSVPVTNALLENQVSSVQSQEQQIEENFGRGMEKGNKVMPMPNEESYIDSVSSATDFVVVLKLMLIGLGLTIVSSLASVIFVMRYEPLKILSQRD